MAEGATLVCDSFLDFSHYVLVFKITVNCLPQNALCAKTSHNEEHPDPIIFSGGERDVNA